MAETWRLRVSPGMSKIFSLLGCGSTDGLKHLDLPAKPVKHSSLEEPSSIPTTQEIPQLPDLIIELALQYLISTGDMRSLRRASLVCKQFKRIASSLAPTPPKTLKMPALPDEILLEIFAAVRFNTSSDDAVSDLASSMRVSRQWYRVGMPLLYKNFVMDVNYRNATLPGSMYYSWEYLPSSLTRYNFIPSARFYSTASKLWSQPWTNAGLGTWIQSLSIEMHFEDTERSIHMQSITEVIKVLPNIRTFSVRAAPLRQNNILLRHKFTNLIADMPRKIVNFELDLQGRDTYHDVIGRPDTQVCELLSKLLPQLRTLRLRLSALCIRFLSEFLKPEEELRKTCPDLKALSISLATRTFSSIERCCSEVRWVHPASPSTELVNVLEAHVQDGGMFPNLKVCSLTCLRFDSSAPGTMPQRIICKTFEPRMKTWTKRAYFPYAEGFDPPWYVRTDADGDDAETIMQGRTEINYGISGIPSDVKLIHGKATDAVFEGDAGWMEDAFGARYPPNV